MLLPCLAYRCLYGDDLSMSHDTDRIVRYRLGTIPSAQEEAKMIAACVSAYTAPRMDAVRSTIDT